MTVQELRAALDKYLPDTVVYLFDPQQDVHIKLTAADLETMVTDGERAATPNSQRLWGLVPEPCREEQVVALS